MQPFITHIVPTLSAGGAERVALELAARLPSEGFRTRLLVLFEGGSLARELRDRDVRWAHVGSAAAGPRLVARAVMLRRLRRLLFAEPERAPDIVHTHLFGADVWTSAVRLLQIGRKQPSAFISTEHSVNQADGALRHAARRWSARRMDRVVAVSREVQRYVHEDLAVPSERVLYIPNGIDVDRLRMRTGRPFHDAPHLLMVGRLSPEKGHAVVLRALQHVSLPWQLRVVGTGPSQRALKELSEQLGLASRVRFLGERKDIPALLADADLFLFPSQWEGLGLALLEAVAAGVPVLASDLPAIREFMPAERCLPSHDAHAWRAAITEVLTEPTPTIAQAAGFATDVRVHYDVTQMVRHYAALYRTLLV